MAKEKPSPTTNSKTSKKPKEFSSTSKSDTIQTEDRKALLRDLLRDQYIGLTEDDYKDTSRMEESELHAHCAASAELLENTAYKNELGHLTHQMEMYLARYAKTEDDLIFGRAALYAYDLLDKRFRQLALQLEHEKNEEEPEQLP